MEEFWNEVEKIRKKNKEEVESNKGINLEIQELNNKSPTENEIEPRKKKNCQTYFCVGYSDI